MNYSKDIDQNEQKTKALVAEHEGSNGDKVTHDTDTSLTEIEQERFKKYVKMYEDEISRLHELFNKNMNMVVASKTELMTKIATLKQIDH